VLADFMVVHRASILSRTRARVARRAAPRPTERELDSGVALFLDQLTQALLRATPSVTTLQEISTSATAHGGEMLHHGFSVSQVVHGYGDVYQAVVEAAEEADFAISARDLGTLGRCLDDAIAQAVTEYMRRRELAISDEEILRSGELAHEMRNRLSAAVVGFELVRRGTVPIGGSVSALVSRNLARLGTLIHRSLVDVRLKVGVENREQVAVVELIEEAEVEGAIEASARNLQLTVMPVPGQVAVEVDRQLVAGAIANLMQNAFKFTRAQGHVALRTVATADRVLIEVEDQCGGLPAGKAEQLFDAFAQRGEDRSGLGLGLFISRKSVEASGGHLQVRDLPGRGCVFTIDLPRTSSPPAL
jgi:signal transduction histidine kinase